VAILGENGAGKTTLLRCLMSQLQPQQGIVKWAESATLGYCPQDTSADFAEDLTLFEWLSQWRLPRHDDQIVRATLGRLLFSADDFTKSVKCIEALNLALEHYDGTLFFVSHDREFVSSLATRILEIKNNRVIDFQGTYDEYLASQEQQAKALAAK
jgi:ATPase subunit of ABC transporter with duplicated ATPase domains